MEREQNTAAARIGSLTLAIFYAVLVVCHLTLLSGWPRWGMATLAALSAVMLAVIHWRTRRGRWAPATNQGDCCLMALCLIPLVNSLAHLAVTGMLATSIYLMLAVVTVAGVNPHRRQVISLLTASTIAWGVLVWLTVADPWPLAVHYVIPLGLALALAAVIFLVRSRVTEALNQARKAWSAQLTDSMRLRTAAEESAKRFRGVFEASPVGISVSDEHGRFVQVNDALCATLGRPAEEIVGHSAADFTHPEDLATITNAGALIDASADGVTKVEKRYLRPDGSVRWAWATMRHVPGPDGQTYTLAHVQDVSDHKADEAKLRQSREAMAATAAIATASQRSTDVRPVAVEAARKFSHARAVTLLEPTGRGSLSVTAVSGQDELHGVEVDLAEPSAVARVWMTGEPLFINHVEGHPLVNQRLQRLVRGGTLMWHPIMVADEVRALMVVIWDEDDIAESDSRAESVSLVASEVSSALLAEDMRAQLERATITDPLTGLLNRRGWAHQMEALVAHSERSLKPFTVAMVDLDHFKRYNDTHGHDRGDQALENFAARAREALRSVDVLARWGGEEFVVALRDTDAHEAAAVLERLRVATAGELTCSIGYSAVAPGGSPAEGLALADQALYEAKGAGRNQTHCVDFPSAPQTTATAV